MSTYIRCYAKYLNEKAFSYRQMAFDFCKVKRGYVLSILYFVMCLFYISLCVFMHVIFCHV